MYSVHYLSLSLLYWKCAFCRIKWNVWCIEKNFWKDILWTKIEIFSNYVDLSERVGKRNKESCRRAQGDNW